MKFAIFGNLIIFKKSCANMSLFDSALGAIKSAGDKNREYQEEATSLPDRDLIRRIRNMSGQPLKRAAHLKEAKSRGITAADIRG